MKRMNKGFKIYRSLTLGVGHHLGPRTARENSPGLRTEQAQAMVSVGPKTWSAPPEAMQNKQNPKQKSKEKKNPNKEPKQQHCFQARWE